MKKIRAIANENNFGDCNGGDDASAKIRGTDTSTGRKGLFRIQAARRTAVDVVAGMSRNS